MRVGVIGLGWRWRQRYRPALHALRKFFIVSCVCDQVPQRAVREARRLGCAAAGPAELLEHPDVEAVLLLDRQWFGLWPVQRACELDKPVLCCPPLESDIEHADALSQAVQDRSLVLVAERLLAAAPAMSKLRQLLHDQLGAVRAVTCDLSLPGELSAGVERPSKMQSPAELLEVADSHLLDTCAALWNAEPLAVLAAGREADGLASIRLEFAGGGAAEVHRRYGIGLRARLSFQVIAERGWVAVNWPERICWSDGDGQHLLKLAVRQQPGLGVLRHFHQAVQEGRALPPLLSEERRALGWLRAAAQSRAQGQRIPLPPG
jgi:predicted dehydrogenase